MQALKKWIIRNRLMLAGIFIGAIAGYLYWNQVGCSNGTCRITGRWYNSTVYGALTGGLLFSIFKREKNGNNTTQ